MSEDINFVERYDELLDIKPNYGYDRVLPPVKFNYVGFEIDKNYYEIAKQRVEEALAEEFKIETESSE